MNDSSWGFLPNSKNHDQVFGCTGVQRNFKCRYFTNTSRAHCRMKDFCLCLQLWWHCLDYSAGPRELITVWEGYQQQSLEIRRGPPSLMKGCCGWCGARSEKPSRRERLFGAAALISGRHAEQSPSLILSNQTHTLPSCLHPDVFLSALPSNLLKVSEVISPLLGEVEPNTMQLNWLITTDLMKVFYVLEKNIPSHTVHVLTPLLLF